MQNAEDEANIPDDENDQEEHEPFCLKDHLEIEELEVMEQKKCFFFSSDFCDFFHALLFFLNYGV